MNREEIEIIRNNLLFQVFEKADHDALTLKLIEEAFEKVLQLQQKTITEEEIAKECWERYNLYNSQFWRGKREGFLECAKWIREKLK